MKTEELAEKAFEIIRKESGPSEGIERFTELPAQVRHGLLEIAGKGGDTTPFGQAVIKILAGEGQQKEGEESDTLRAETGAKNAAGKSSEGAEGSSPETKRKPGRKSK